MVVVTAGADERSLVADPGHHVEAEHAHVEGERTVDVGDLQMDVADVDARVDRAACGGIAGSRSRFHLEIVGYRGSAYE